MSAECTPQDHIAELIYFTRIARAEGRQEGILIGHEAGQYIGEIDGFNRGARSTSAFNDAAKSQWIAGYLTRISDEIALRGEAA